jgi:hypothetical protein
VSTPAQKTTQNPTEMEATSACLRCSVQRSRLLCAHPKVQRASPCSASRPPLIQLSGIIRLKPSLNQTLWFRTQMCPHKDIEMTRAVMTMAQHLIKSTSDTSLAITWGQFHAHAKGWFAVVVLAMGLFSCGATNSYPQGQGAFAPIPPPLAAPQQEKPKTVKRTREKQSGRRAAVSTEWHKMSLKPRDSLDIGTVRLQTRHVTKYRERFAHSCLD